MNIIRRILNTIRRIFGVLWLLLAPAALYFIINNALNAFAKADKAIADAVTDAARSTADAAKTNAILQWSIIIIIFIPIAIGLIIFGRYALAGEYDTQGNVQKEMA